MPKIHHIETVFIDPKPSEVKTYGKQETAVEKAQEVAMRMRGAVNVRIHPVVVNGVIRFTPVFFCFRDQTDMMVPGRAGFYCYA